MRRMPVPVVNVVGVVLVRDCHVTAPRAVLMAVAPGRLVSRWSAPGTAGGQDGDVVVAWAWVVERVQRGKYRGGVCGPDVV